MREDRPETTGELGRRIIKDVKKIGSSGHIIKDVGHLKELVEEPLVPACEILYTKNIETVASNANCVGDATDFFASIGINWDTLSPENREIAQRLGLEFTQGDEFGSSVTIQMPISGDSDTKMVSDYFANIANQFVEQAPTWIPVYSIEDYKKMFGYREDEEVGPQDIVDQGWFYDAETKRIYESEDHYRKIKAWDESHSEKD